MIALWILAGLIFLVLLLLLCPATVKFVYDKKPLLRISLAGIIVLYDSSKPEKTEEKSGEKDSEKKSEEEKKPGLFKQLKEQNGIVGAVRSISELVKILTDRIKWFLKKVSFNRFVLKLSVASDNAAKTALEYGTVCSIVYPVLAMLTSTADFKAKSIDIKADFDGTEPEAYIELFARSELLFVLIAVYSAVKEYKKWKRNVIANG